MLIEIKMKKSVMELGYNGRLKIYINPKILRRPGHLSPFLQNGIVYLAEIFYGV